MSIFESTGLACPACGAINAFEAVQSVNADRPGTAVSAGGDVSDTAEIQRLIDLAEAEFGAVDLYFANAGITGVAGLDISEREWDQSIDVNLRAHTRAAQLLVPKWVERGEGYFVSTASAADTPIKFSDLQPEITGSPLLGEHTDEVLAELGYSNDQIATMREARAV